ncbi:ribonucleoside-diphosphate reductase 2 alpha chain [Escherichia coli]|uniref:Ribonucleoside-diphosphate reductase 2 alpha chain n=1 Tax=Escherichia coli TaxID=562 RepID=A0A376UEB2_ECOLX|nr:ribonucleoside-diphosphate reductase 2 alpha chain [Escherichia coli]
MPTSSALVRGLVQSIYMPIIPIFLRFLDTKRENADEKIRIKTLSLGVVIPDITFHLAKENAQMALFRLMT